MKIYETLPNTHSQQSRKYFHVRIVLISVCLHMFVSARDKRMITHNPHDEWSTEQNWLQQGTVCSPSPIHTHTRTCQQKVRPILQPYDHESWCPYDQEIWKFERSMYRLEHHEDEGINIHAPRYLHSTPRYFTKIHTIPRYVLNK